MSEERIESDGTWPSRFWYWMVLAPVGALALFLLFLNGLVLASLAFDTVRDLGVRILFAVYLLGALTAPLMFWRALKNRDVGGAWIWAAALSVAISIVVLPTVVSSFAM